jgi:hypothetical protein
MKEENVDSFLSRKSWVDFDPKFVLLFATKRNLTVISSWYSTEQG